MFNSKENNSETTLVGKTKVKFYLDDVLRMIFSVLITIWATVFINNWGQEEAKFRYYWGTDEYEQEEPERENFVPDRKERFIFDEQIAKTNTIKGIFKTLISYTVMIIIIAITLFLNYLLFQLKAAKTKEEEEYAKLHVEVQENLISSYLKWPLIIGMMTSVVIKVMNYIYKYFTIWATEWENYNTQTKYENSLAMKFIFFEFINNYSSLIYISFFKDNIEGCIKNDCLTELNIQIYMVLATNLAFNLMELGYPYAMMIFSMRTYIKKVELISGGKSIECNPHSLEYQGLCTEYNTTMYDYIEVMILFGYVTLFSVACPLTPILVMILLYFERFVDTCKLVFLSRVTLLDKADGIEVFGKIFKIIYFIGMISSISFILFSQESKGKYSNYERVLYLAIFENIVLVLMFTLKINILPEWFQNIPLLKQLYFKKFYSKHANQLPHHFLRGDQSLNLIKKKEEEEMKEGINFFKNLLSKEKSTKGFGLAFKN